VGPELILRRPTLRLSHYSFAVKERSWSGDLLGGGGGERSLYFLVASEPCLAPANWLSCAFGRAAHGTRGFRLCRRIGQIPMPHTTQAARSGRDNETQITDDNSGTASRTLLKAGPEAIG
jgi:hypothetical protein